VIAACTVLDARETWVWTQTDVRIESTEVKFLRSQRILVRVRVEMRVFRTSRESKIARWDSGFLLFK
jgi:hypothetical protein